MAPPKTRWVVVTAVKRLAAAKTRLALAPSDRAELTCAMAQDVVDAALRSTRVVAVLVVTPDAGAAQAIRRPGVRVFRGEPGNGLNAALSYGLRAAAGGYPAYGTVILPADLPCLTGKSLDLALDLSDQHQSMVMSDADGEGTALLTQVPGCRVEPQFGEGSFAAHLAAGAYPLTDTRLRPIRRDVDTLADLHAAIAIGVGTNTRTFLRTQLWSTQEDTQLLKVGSA